MQPAQAPPGPLRDLANLHFRCQHKGYAMRQNRARAGVACAVLSLLLLAITALPGWAELRIDLPRGKLEPLPIAIPAFPGEGGNGQLGRDIAGVVSNDLQSSGLFRPIDPKSFIQNVSTGGPPRFGDWRQINAQ